jgi:hypothetical protein
MTSEPTVNTTDTALQRGTPKESRIRRSLMSDILLLFSILITDFSSL